MDFMEPVYTQAAECQDCYKCLRRCPVKSIQIQDGHARIMNESCIMCGTCVRTCPAGAKKIRNDLQRARLLLNSRDKVYMSIAPSWRAEFEGSEDKLIAAVKKLGFAGVSETALGAQEVSANTAKILAEGKPGVYISSACPTVVEYVLKYMPKLAGSITGLLSPLLAHCKMLRKEYGDDIGIVFAGPCIGKKKESDTSEGLLDVAITFQDLKQWLNDEDIDQGSLQPENGEDVFVPQRAAEGSLYPVDGGMIAGIKANCDVTDAGYMTFSGMDNIMQVLEGLENFKPDKPVFLELLACDGGCVNGPAAQSEKSSALKRLDVLSGSEYEKENIPRKPGLDITASFTPEPKEEKKYPEHKIREALERVGKYRPEDELNCSGCGYDSCRQFAEALLEGRAEESMCVSYMRQLAHKKADMLIKTMPGGVVIVDEKLEVVESNRRFASMLGSDAENLYEQVPGLEKAKIEKLLPNADMFRRVIESLEQVLEKDVKINNAVLHITVFTIEQGRLAGAFLQDITAPAVAKEQIINKARNVIEKNLQTVQQIAYLLGENASDSEVILNSIVESFQTGSEESQRGKDAHKE
ncbi:[Fe-Fe] hydrogenase large subunit C-terminal domain-containing protein [Sedimentisphaera salicampi]|uniref:Iron hydrogenase 1 n=1 Tax=Sedimentisphaera salicampi TaxID=1941349 RepID=A0A1W6LQ29_9BACT|nr:[Fe-Fe] hydrogenase large subunit C-terminal domain-containing protein [Sedimentisphaera salicampi]ARN57879.1 Iron hydrogenase 1 [Sedimentisphaera salicampi]